jgi:hypothetical protein
VLQVLQQHSNKWGNDRSAAVNVLRLISAPTMKLPA